MDEISKEVGHVYQKVISNLMSEQDSFPSHENFRTNRYHSLFDELGKDPEKDPQAYSGTLDKVLHELELAVSYPHGYNLHARILHPPRVVRQLLNYKVDHETTGVEAYIMSAIDLVRSVYRGDKDALEKLRLLRQEVSESDISDIMTAPFEQPSDWTTWIASKPKKSQATAERLIQQTDRKEVLFIALSHGGLAAGMDVYLRYCNLADTAASAFYTVRFSVHRSKDRQPHITPTELEYIEMQAQGKSVVIFDEDAASGRTLQHAQIFFANHVFTDIPVLTTANIDIFGALNK